MTNPAVVNFAEEPHSVEIREIEEPDIGADDVLLQVAAVGVCGSDLHQWTSQHSWPVNYPVVLGHEFAGNITAVGKNVLSWREGDRVVSETAAVIDPDNPMTRRGLYNLDTSRKGFGYGVNGAMTRYVRVPARCLHAVPEGLAFEKAALTEPCCVAYNATIKNSRIDPGDRVLVLGPWHDRHPLRGACSPGRSRSRHRRPSPRRGSASRSPSSTGAMASSAMPCRGLEFGTDWERMW